VTDIGLPFKRLRVTGTSSGGELPETDNANSSVALPDNGGQSTAKVILGMLVRVN